jgi:hypothetical protein
MTPNRPMISATIITKDEESNIEGLPGKSGVG